MVGLQRIIAAGRVLSRPLPRDRAQQLYLQVARRSFQRYMSGRLGVYFLPVEDGPPPTRELIEKTAALRSEDVEEQLRPDPYFARGYSTLLDWMRRLETFGFNLRTTGAIFELGCGSARLLRHFRGIEGIRLVGSDTNGECIRWCAEHVPGPEYHVNQLEPPLDFAEDRAFDLVYAYSVFTHIPVQLQPAWLNEIRRVLRPDGFFLCTVLGESTRRQMLGPEELAELRRTGAVTFTSNDGRASLSTQRGGSGWDVFQTRAEIIRVFGSVFRIRDFVPASQDLLILQRPG